MNNLSNLQIEGIDELEKVIFPEMEKLEKYLMLHDITYEAEWQKWFYFITIGKEKLYKQIFVPSKENREWDAICHPGSYGFEQGLLEIMGDILTPEDEEYDSVVGNLTADEVIERIELKEKPKSV